MYALPIPLTVYATESSLEFSVHANQEQPFWAEAHVHFGRFDIVRITLVVSNNGKSHTEGIGFVELFIIELNYQLDAYRGVLGRGLKTEVYLTVFYNQYIRRGYIVGALIF